MQTLLDFTGFDSSGIVFFTGRNSHIHREPPGKFESTNLGLEILSLETGRSRQAARLSGTPNLPTKIIPTKIR